MYIIMKQEKKVTDTIRDFKDESGFEYSCYFDWSGRMMIDSEEWLNTRMKMKNRMMELYGQMKMDV